MKEEFGQLPRAVAVAAPCGSPAVSPPLPPQVTSYTPATLLDSVGREAEHGWNMWASQRFLHAYGAFSSVAEPGPFTSQPRQFDVLLKRAALASDVVRACVCMWVRAYVCG